MTVLEDYVGKFNLRAVRYDPRYSSLYCMQHKAGSTNFNIVLWRIKNSVNPDIPHGTSKFAIPHARHWLAAVQEGMTLEFAKEHEFVEDWTLDQLSRGFKQGCYRRRPVVRRRTLFYAGPVAKNLYSRIS